jgi:hypothetical protein
MEAAGVAADVVTFNSLTTIIARAAQVLDLLALLAQKYKYSHRSWQAGDITDPDAALSQGEQVRAIFLSLRPHTLVA